MKTAIAFAAMLAIALAVAAPTAGAKQQRDFGDAPDGARAGYEGSGKLERVPGRFPSKRRSNGASHAKVGKLVLGARVTKEGDSEQVDRDPHDDGFAVAPVECQRTSYRFVVDASGLGNKALRRGRAFLNVWADWTQDGDWRDKVRCGKKRVPEWVIDNKQLKLRSFAERPVQEIVVEALAGASGRQLWLRASLSDSPFKKKVKAGGKTITNDGRGSFTLGETEDYFTYLDGPAEEGPPANEFATCSPGDAAVSHDQSPLTLSFKVYDLSVNPFVGLLNPLKGDLVKDLSRNLPQGWKVTVPAGPPPVSSANLNFKKDSPERTQLGTLSFQIRSPKSGLLYVVNCRVEVVHEKKRKPPKADFGDAPDNFNTGGTSLEPLCVANVVEEFLCRYPSLAPHGPSHLRPELIGLGKSVTSERTSLQVDEDNFDDGFAVVDPQSCQPATFVWRIVVENPKAKGLGQAGRKLLKRLVKQIKRRRAKIFLNAWFDAGNDGDWDGGLCQDGSESQTLSVSDHAVSDSKLTKSELKQLAKSVDPDSGQRAITIQRPGAIARINPERPGCLRGQITVDDRYHPDASGHSSHPFQTFDIGGGALTFFQPEAAVLPSYPYLLGETEDYCNGLGNPSDTPDGGNSDPACNDGKDNDGDGLADADDPGCVTDSGPGRNATPFYDSSDRGEETAAKSVPCPADFGDVTTTQLALTSSGSTLERHMLLKPSGGTFFPERRTGDADFAQGEVADSGSAYGCSKSDAAVSWVVNGMTVTYTITLEHKGGTETGTSGQVELRTTSR